MIDEPHYPSKWTVVLVFFFLGLMIAGVFVWAFVLNRGTLLVSSDRAFQLDVGGQTLDCAQRCEVKLVPQVYQLGLSSVGYQDQVKEVQIERWREERVAVVFELEPYLEPIEARDIPDQESQWVELQPVGGQYEMHRLSDDQVLASFETLERPIVHEGELYSFVQDQARLFVVDHEQSRRLRLFDESVSVKDVLVSDSGKRALFFIVQEGIESQWLWSAEGQELRLLEQSFPEGRVQWKPGVEHVVYVLTAESAEEAGIMQEFLDTLDVSEKTYRLLEWNLDTGRSKALLEMSAQPKALIRRG